jgi:hypothetical protein
MTPLWSDLEKQVAVAPSTTARETPPTPPPDVDEEKLRHLRSAIAMIPNVEYGTWISVGQNLKPWGETGRQIWFAWGETNFSAFDAEEAAAKWESFDGSRSDPRAIFRKAEAHGWVNPWRSKPERKAASDKTFEVITAAEFVQRVQVLKWLVDKLVPWAEFGMIYGESGSGKSFFVLYMLVCIALGRPFFDRETRKARVGVVVAEGSAGFRNRLIVIAEQFGVSVNDIPMLVLADRPNFLSEDADAVARAFVAAGGVDVIVIDTLAAVSAGANESSSEDMGAIIAGCQRLHGATGAMVITVHHSGKDQSKGARGWSGLRAACDVEIEVLRDGHERQAEVTKLKDGEEGIKFRFELQVLPLPDEETSCVVVPSGGGLLGPSLRERRAQRRRMGGNEITIFNVVGDLAGLVGDKVPEEVVIDAAVKATGRRRYDFARAIDSLVEHGQLDRSDGMVSVHGGG